jgi:polar amino acid transport system permease protein
MMTQVFFNILAGVPWTLGLTLVSLIIGICVGAVLCAMRLSHSAILRFSSASIILTFRSIPPIVWLFFIFFGVGTNILPLSPFASGAIGLGLITAANMAEIFRGAFAAIHPGQWEAARTLNLGRVSQMVDVIGPQVIRVALPSIATYAIGLLKDSAVASTIGVPETAFQAYHVSQRTFLGLEVYAIAGLLYILLSLPIAAVSRRLDLHMRSKVAR